MSIRRHMSPLLISVMLLAFLTIPVAGQTPVSSPTAATPLDTVVTPDDALRVCSTCAYATIEDALAAAADGTTIEVQGGEYGGPLVIEKPVTLIGRDSPVIDGREEGSVVELLAPNITFQGFIVRNSGSNFDQEDSAIVVEGAYARVLDNQLTNALFGINVAQAPDSVFARNYILGKDVDMGVRGDAFKIWYSHRVQVLENHAVRSRDLLVWYSDGVTIRDNLVEDGRYGFHFMSSNDGTAEHNRLVNNSVGIYLMYGKGFVMRDNLLQGSRGPSGHGLGLKEVDGVLVEGNIICDNRIGVFIDNSPLSPHIHNTFRNNLIAYNDQGFGVLPSSRNNVITRNSMVDNLEQVAILGGGELGDNQWSENGAGNFWSDYAGYDADNDGVGDLPFRSEQLSEQLMGAWPDLQLYRFSVAETAVDFGSRAVPMFRSEPKLTDDYPLVEPVVPANAPSPVGTTDARLTTLWSFVLLALVAIAIWWGAHGARFQDDRQLVGAGKRRRREAIRGRLTVVRSRDSGHD